MSIFLILEITLLNLSENARECPLILLAQMTVHMHYITAEKLRINGVGAAFGARHGVLVLFTISALLVLRELFFTATETRLSDVRFQCFSCRLSISDSSSPLSQQNNEDLWYPFAAVTELLAALLFAVPRLVPTRDELPSEGRGFLPFRLHAPVRSTDDA